MNVVIIEYNAGNLFSVQNTLKQIGVNASITHDKEQIKSADRVLFPGVGEAVNTMKYLNRLGLDCVIKSLEQPTLGICLGMQLMCSSTEEGDVQGLGIFDEQVKALCVKDSTLKSPHIGWNQVNTEQKEEGYFYFLHSFCAQLGKHTLATTHYGELFSSALNKNNFWATQFHPEKSGNVGKQLLKQFIESGTLF